MHPFTVKQRLEACLYQIHARIDEQLNGLTGAGCNASGLLLYYYTLYKTRGDAHSAGRARELLRRILADTQSGLAAPLPGELPFRPRHLAELGYTVSALCSAGFIEEQSTIHLKQWDDMLHRHVMHLFSVPEGCLSEDMLAIIRYFLMRPPNVHPNPLLLSLLSRTYAFIKDRYTSRSLWSHLRRLPPGASIPLGPADGLVGLYLTLMEAYCLGNAREEVKDIVRDSVGLILSLQGEVDFSEQKYALFPDFITVNPDQSGFTRRLNWCAGDLNCSLLFYRAGNLLTDEKFRKLGDLVGLNTLLRKDEASTGVSSSHFYHGSSGVAHFYRTLYGYSLHQSYYAGYEFWIGRTLDFLEKELLSPGQTNYGQAYGLLYGLPGVALTLLSYLDDNKPEWSKWLLL